MAGVIKKEYLNTGRAVPGIGLICITNDLPESVITALTNAGITEIFETEKVEQQPSVEQPKKEVKNGKAKQ